MKIGTEKCEPHETEDKDQFDFRRKTAQQASCFFHHSAGLADDKLELAVYMFVIGLSMCEHSEVDLCKDCSDMIDVAIKRLDEQTPKGN